MMAFGVEEVVLVNHFRAKENTKSKSILVSPTSKDLDSPMLSVLCGIGPPAWFVFRVDVAAKGPRRSLYMSEIFVALRVRTKARLV